MRKWGNGEMRKWGNEKMGRVKGFGRYRRETEGCVEVKAKRWAVIWVGLAYRELIGSLYESWTIGIERVCKKLINSLIQQCQKCQKWGFEAKEKGMSNG